MSNGSESDKVGKMPALVRWLERLLIALGGVLIGAVGSGKFAESPIVVTVSVPGSVSQLTSTKACAAEAAPKCGRSIVGIATFANGDYTLTESSKRNAQLWAQALSHCDGVELQLVGSTSSIPYRQMLPRNNVWLAKERANSVAAVFRAAGLNSIELPEVSREEDLQLLRFVNDRRNGKIDEQLAMVARRVDLNITSLGSCEVSGP